jgi:hypothetical protein
VRSPGIETGQIVVAKTDPCTRTAYSERRSCDPGTTSARSGWLVQIAIAWTVRHF